MRSSGTEHLHYVDTCIQTRELNAWKCTTHMFIHLPHVTLFVVYLVSLIKGKLSGISLLNRTRLIMHAAYARRMFREVNVNEYKVNIF